MNELNVTSHDQCVIELITGRKFTADIKYVCSGGDYVVVENIIDANNCKRSGQQKYYKIEILSIEKLKATKKLSKSNENIDYVTKIGVQQKRMPINKRIDANEIVDRMIDVSAKAIYITQCDEKYHAALKDFESQNLIAVTCSSGNRLGRLEMKESLLVIATEQTVYIFDLLSIGRIHRGLKQIFNAIEPRKIVFNAAKVKDYFEHKENCHIKIYWDILVRLQFKSWFYRRILSLRQ